MSITSTNISLSANSHLITESLPTVSINFAPDKSVDLLKIEGKIQTERFTKILNSMVARTEIALCIQTLTKNSTKLLTILSAQHFAEVLSIVTQHDKEYTEGGRNIAAVETRKPVEKNRLNPDLAYLIYVLNSYPELRKEIEIILKKMEEEYPLKPDPGFKYLLILKHFRDQMLSQMKLTAPEEYKMKHKLRKTEMTNDVHLKKIQDYTALQKKDEAAINQLMCKKWEIVAERKQKLHWLQIDAAHKLKFQVTTSDRQMVVKSRRHEVRLMLLEYQEKRSLAIFNHVTNENLSSENKLRHRRLRVETQLWNWKQKYDNDMCERQAEINEYTKQYEEEMEKVIILEKILAEHEEEYNRLMEERDKEYQEEMSLKMKNSMLEHAARVIQVAWPRALKNRKIMNKLRNEQQNLKKTLAIQKRKQHLLEKKEEEQAKKSAQKESAKKKSGKKKK